MLHHVSPPRAILIAHPEVATTMTEVKKKKLPCYLHPGCLCPKIWTLLDPHPSLSLHGWIYRSALARSQWIPYDTSLNRAEVAFSGSSPTICRRSSLRNNRMLGAFCTTCHMCYVTQGKGVKTLSNYNWKRIEKMDKTFFVWYFLPELMVCELRI